MAFLKKTFKPAEQMLKDAEVKKERRTLTILLLIGGFPRIPMAQAPLV